MPSAVGHGHRTADFLCRFISVSPCRRACVDFIDVQTDLSSLSEHTNTYQYHIRADNVNTQAQGLGQCDLV